MAYDKTKFTLVRHPLKIRSLEVIRTTQITPKMKRITLGGPELAGFTSLAPEDHVKLFFPAPGQSEPILPTVGPLGIVLPVGFKGKPISRDYTPLRYDEGAGELDVDFFLHGHGVASVWAENAAPGQKIGMGGPRGSYVLQQEFPWYLLVGDETALPEILLRIEGLPATARVYAVLLVESKEEEQHVEAQAQLDLRWVHRSTTSAADPELLVRTLRELELPESGGFTWIAGEATEARSVYRHLVQDRGWDRSSVHVSGHWKRGVVAHDHHEPIEA